MNQTEATGENDPRDKEHSDCSDASPTQESSGAKPLIDVPDDFDLHSAKSQYSSTPFEEQPRCPECGSVNIFKKAGGPSADKDRKAPGEYSCKNCRAHFDEPAEPRPDRSGETVMTDGGTEIVPEDFDLDAIRSQTSSTPDTAKPRCPHCGSVRIHRKVNGSKRGAPRRTPGQYRCHTCREHFDSPQQADGDRDVLMTDGGSEIVPDGFDLEDAKREPTTTPREEQPRCPECGSQSLHFKPGGTFDTPNRKPGNWRCNNCCAHFDEPVSADELQRTEIATDGGTSANHYERGEGISASAFPAIGVGAVLYEDRPDTPADERRLHHVVDIRISIESQAVYYVVEDGTHTTRHHYHEADLLGDFEPAGWQWPSGRKPTYHLTRNCGVDDKMDLMTDGGYNVDAEDWHDPDKNGWAIAPIVNPLLLERAIETWSERLQTEIAIEEFSEAITALARDRRWGDTDESPKAEYVLEELADVRIMVDQLAVIYGVDAFNDHVEAKLDYLRGNLDAESENEDVATDGGQPVERKTMQPERPGKFTITVNGDDPLHLSLDAGDFVEFEWQPTVTDGGVETRELPPAVAIDAEHYSGDDRCAYGCGDEAAYRLTVEGERGPPFVACRPCLNRHNIYPEDNELVTDGGRLQGRRAFRADAHSAISEAGVGDQAPGGGCRHSDDGFPCWDCFVAGGEDGDER